MDTTGRRGGQLRVGVVDGRDGRDGRTFAVALGFRACVEAFEMQRFQVMAAGLRARLVVVDTPGFGYADSRLLPAERRALRAGDFTVVAARMWRAVKEIAEPTGVIGYSMGCSTGAALARTSTAVDTVVLVEPVAGQRWRLLRLAAAMHRDDRHVRHYLDETARITHAVAPYDRRKGEPQPRQRNTDLLALAGALCRAGLTTDLVTAAPREVIVAHGDVSGLSLAATADAVAETLRSNGVPTTVLSTPGHHGLWHSLPAVARLTDQIAGALR